MNPEGINALLNYFGIWGAISSHICSHLHDCDGCMAVAKDLTKRTQSLRRNSRPNRPPSRPLSEP